MKKKWIVMAILSVFLLSGCAPMSAQDMYRVPKRSQSYMNLQTVIDISIAGAEYNSPQSGENQQAVQLADLDADGTLEYLLFTRDTSNEALRIFVFGTRNGEFVLLDTIECTGTSFERVEYVQMDSRGGVEVVVSRKVSDQVLSAVSVYTMVDGRMEKLIGENCSKFFCCDLTGNRNSELLLLRPGQDESEKAVAEVYTMASGMIEYSGPVPMSETVDKIHRIVAGRLGDGVPAVYIASEVSGTSIVTDILSMPAEGLVNVSYSAETGSSIHTLRGKIYADDVDGDGVLELPEIVTVDGPQDSTPITNGNTNNIDAAQRYLLRWYAMTSGGEEIEKCHTFHNLSGGWFVVLEQDLVRRMLVTQQGNNFVFAVWNDELNTAQTVFSVYAFTGQNREEQAEENNRFLLLRTGTTVYAAKLEASATEYGITRDCLIENFHLIQQDWKTEGT